MLAAMLITCHFVCGSLSEAMLFVSGSVSVPFYSLLRSRAFPNIPVLLALYFTTLLDTTKLKPFRRRFLCRVRLTAYTGG